MTIKIQRPARSRSGMTLIEVAVSLAVSCLVFGGILLGYVQTSDRAEWSSYSLAAQSLAVQGLEQCRAGKWDPHAWPPLDEMRVTNYAVVETLDVPVSGGSAILATNYIQVKDSSTNPPLRELRADCVWILPSRPGKIRGPFTNSAVTLRACDQ